MHTEAVLERKKQRRREKQSAEVSDETGELV